MVALIEARASRFETLLSDSKIDPRLFMEGVRRALIRNPKLLHANRRSFLEAAINCAADGLIPDGRVAAFVPYKGEVQYIPMVQGLLDIAYRSERFQSIEAQVVYEGDQFEHELGDAPYIKHSRSLTSVPGRIIGSYAVAKTINGGVFREVVGIHDLTKIMAMSRAKEGPNVDWPGEMARKASLRRLWKYLPRSLAMESVLDHDDVIYDAPPKPEPLKLTTDFTPDPPPQEAVEVLPPEAISAEAAQKEAEHQRRKAERRQHLDKIEAEYPVAPPHDPDTGEVIEEEVRVYDPVTRPYSNLMQRARGLHSAIKLAVTMERLEKIWSDNVQLRNEITAGAPDTMDEINAMYNEKLEVLSA